MKDMLGSLFVLAALALQGGVPAASIQAVAPSPAAAARVQIVGASPQEEATARKALAPLGAKSPVTRVVFGSQSGGRSVSVAFEPRADDPTGGFEGEWLAHAFLTDVAARLEALGTRVTWFEVDGDGYSVQGVQQPSRSPRQLALLAEAIATRGQAQGRDLAKVVAYPSGSGAVEVVIRLPRDEFLRGTNTDWRDVLGRGFAGGYSAYVLVLGPGDVPVNYGANFWPNGGAGAYGPLGTTTPRTVPPLTGPVTLRIAIDRMFPKAERFNFSLDCEQDPVRCAAFGQEWTYLIPPTEADSYCSPPVGIDQLTVTGSVAGVPIRRSYDGCYGGIVLRWEKLLGVTTRR